LSVILNEFCKMKKGCLSEEIFEVVSNEESHYKRRSFDGKASRMSQDDKNTLFCRILIILEKGERNVESL